jgi:hypothetical protein
MATWGCTMVERARDVKARVGATHSHRTKARPDLLCTPGAIFSRPPTPQAGTSAGGAAQAVWHASAPAEPDPPLPRTPAEESC